LTADPEDLERGWQLAESRAPDVSDKLEADPLSITVNGFPLMVGVDSLGARHLLIPIPADVAVPTGSSGPAIGLRKRSLIVDAHERTFADLSCSRKDLFDEFVVVARDVIRAVTSNETDAAEEAAEVLASWRELLRAFATPRLDKNGIIGLYGELLILDRLQEFDARKAAEAWTGPTGGRYDFQRGSLMLEVKTATARRGRPFVVHGLDQLEVAPHSKLFLCWIRLEVGVDRGTSLRSLAERVLDGSQNRSSIEQKLRNLGYDLDQQELFELPLLNELERRLYRVDDRFPTLTRTNLIGGDLPRGILAVSYEVDLAGDMPSPVEAGEETRVIHGLAGNS
jgi:hypothetical protein